MRVDIWSDIVCPWCYIGKARFEKALASFPHAGEVEVEFHSFELQPGSPKEPVPMADGLAAKMGVTAAQARQMEEGVAENARGEGLAYSTDRLGGNTFDHHRLIHFAKAQGQGRDTALVEELFAAYFGAGENVFDRDALVALAEKAGLDADAARAVLDSDDYAGAVRDDVDAARSMGATGVPFFVVDQRYGVSGAQPSELFTEVLERAWADAHPAAPTLVTPAAPVADDCADGSCAVPADRA